jgi:hypothetical protein
MLPGHIGLLLDITTGLRLRSTRTQGDSHAIRGLLQLLGDLFRERDLARYEVGRLITIDLIYDVLHSALDADAKEVDLAIERLKRRSGFERLDPDQRHQVLRHLREGAAPGTDERAVAPALEALEGQLAARRDVAEAKALAQLDALLETLGETPVVEVALDLGGREIETEAELERLLDEVRRRILHQLAARHRVRLR